MSKQRGFTILELMIVLSISAAVMLVTLNLLFSVQWGTSRNVNQVNINSALSPAITAIYKDLFSAQSSNITEDITTLRWTDYTGNQTDHTVTYGFNELHGTGPTVLWRIYDGYPEIVARDITDLTFTSENRTIHVSITSSGEETPPRSKTIEFIILKRYEVDVQ